MRASIGAGILLSSSYHAETSDKRGVWARLVSRGPGHLQGKCYSGKTLEALGRCSTRPIVAMQTALQIVRNHLLEEMR
ncbi:MAG: hypothetical protein CL912_09660 [Deltaproteobacteria bacterium]|nr:hypothetical protein [Deltaproteobacteria bacterium]